MQCDMKLRTEAEKRSGSLFYKFNRGTWLQMDAQATAAVLNSYVASKIMNRNEARDKLDLNPVPDGDVFENPNIQVAPEQTAEAVRQTASYMAASVLFDRFLETECDRVEKATGNKNFIEWVEKTYTSLEKTYRRQAEQLGVDAELFLSDLMERKQSLIDACDCQPEELDGKIKTLVNGWRKND
jgi:hypothetical protein